MKLYQLCEITTVDGQIVEKVLAEDLPDIVMGKYLREIKAQGFTKC